MEKLTQDERFVLYVMKTRKRVSYVHYSLYKQSINKLAKEIIKNAQVAGQYLYENGIKVLGESKGFTKSHQLAIDVREFGGGKKMAKKIEDANIILNKNLLPYDDQSNRDSPSGLRMGFQDITRRGFKEGDIKMS